MAKISRLAGSTGHILTLFIQDSSSSTGAGLTGLLYSTSGLACYYKRNRGTASVAVPLVDIATLGTYASGGFKAIDGTNMPGFYEFHPPDAALATGAGSVAFVLRGAANMAVTPVEVELTAVDTQSPNFGQQVVNADAGTVSASPTPTTTSFTATGSTLNTTNGSYATGAMVVAWQTGANKGQKFLVSGHTQSGGNHAFTVATMPTAPSATDTFLVY